jgi:DNA-binding response OmpR family regulator
VYRSQPRDNFPISVSVRLLTSAARFRPIVYVISREATTTTICAGVLAAHFGARLDVRVFDALDAGLIALERMRPTLMLADWRIDGAKASPLLERAGATAEAVAVPVVMIADARDLSRPARFEDIGAIDTLWRPLRPQRVAEVCELALARAQAPNRVYAKRNATLALAG